MPSAADNNDVDASQDVNGYAALSIRSRAGSSPSIRSYSSPHNEKTPARSFVHRYVHGAHGKVA